VSSELPAGGERETARALRVQAVFHVADDQQAQAVAAKLIDRAHEIANLPEYECDVDVSVELASSEGSSAPGAPVGALPRGRTPKS
jgi:hypothetical protein